MSFLINTANALVNGKPQLESMLIAFKNPSIPLEERWEAYTILVEGNVLVSNRGYGDGFIDTLKNADNPKLGYSLYDDLYMDRHETKSFPDMLDMINEWDAAATPESVIKWKEAVLASGLSSFTNDW